tara:strand:- start:1445 stop:2383 length:939 start_codon:yes stop_codon:yes gene_type:complete
LGNYNNLNILIIGGSGQVGSEIQVNPKNKDFKLHFPKSSELDLASKNSIINYFNTHAPDLVINLGAYTKVDKAEEEKERCSLINSMGPKVLAEEANKREIGLIHISTDYVFGKDSSGPYNCQNNKAPINYYGQTKAEGEDNVLEIYSKSLVIRLSSVFSNYGDNFVKSIIRSIIKNDKTKVVSDQKISLTSAFDFSNNMMQIIKLYYKDFFNNKNNCRILHFASFNYTDWYSVSKVILNEMNFMYDSFKNHEIEPILLKDWKSMALRSNDTRLTVDENYLGYNDIKLSIWEEAVRNVVRKSLPEIIRELENG